jgi:methionyl aminopeptidase
MREAGHIVALAVEKAFASLEPGITTRELDDIARREIESHGAAPAFLGLYGFPATACISINEEIVHGIPGERVIEDGDLVSIDCGAIVGGMYSDHARTVVAGTSTPEKDRLVKVTSESLAKGIGQIKPGNRIGDVSHAVESYVLSQGFDLVREYVGHGIGRELHEPPQVPNFGPAAKGPLLRVGMVLAVEPMVNVGTWKTRTLDDDWTVVTEDGELSAHFEHTIVVTPDGPEVLTVL